MSYLWDVSIANLLPKPFAIIGVPTTNILHKLELRPTPSNNLARFDLEDGPGTHYNKLTTGDKVKKVIDFEVKFTFKCNHKVVVPFRTYTMSDHLWVVLWCV